jgi:hypothetical protein
MSSFLERKNILALFIVICLTLVFRTSLFYFKWDNLRHGTALRFGSAAAGLYKQGTLSYQETELREISKLNNNYTGNYLEFYQDSNRQKLIEFLPGPPLLLFLLWKFVPFYNFSSYIWLQILLETMLIGFLYSVLLKYDSKVGFLTAMIMALNLAVIKRTLMMGYDFWPQFCVLINFIGLCYAFDKENGHIAIFVLGLLTACIVWFRSITSLLPFFIAVLMAMYLRKKTGVKKSLLRVSLYLIPIIISITALSTYRYETTGSYRPTRSTFWHTFFAGVGQFSNPYGLVNDDLAVWQFAKTLNKDLDKSTLWEMYHDPNSNYELTLKKEAFRFISAYPHLFIRNILYRIAIMISPLLYRGGDFIPNKLSNYLAPFGVLLLLIWFIGMYYTYERFRALFWISAAIYLYFFLSFSWFYVVGRVILPFLFVNIFVYLFGLKYIAGKVKYGRIDVLRLFAEILR